MARHGRGKVSISSLPKTEPAFVAHPLRVGPTIDRETCGEIRRAMELSHAKWDVQVGDINALAPFPLIIEASTWRQLTGLAEQLFGETLALEQALLERPALHAAIGLAAPLRRLFANGTPTPAAARIMRFDFHYTSEGWRISEVNSDVPGGYTEATAFTRMMAEHVPDARPAGDPSRALVDAMVGALGKHATIALINAPGHMEDHQVVAHLAACLRAEGLRAGVVSLRELRWRAGRAHLLADEGVDAIVRYYQVEWLARLPRGGPWQSMFVDGRTPVANPGLAALSESKRLPLIWDELRVALPTWRHLLPETRALSDAPWLTDDGWLLKSAYSNNGDTVSIRGAMTRGAWAKRLAEVALNPRSWVAQRRFTVVPVAHESGPLFPCIGVYVIDGKAAGAYARLANGAIVDGRARDVALLVSAMP
jgi:glutathionylspermidine synthase